MKNNILISTIIVALFLAGVLFLIFKAPSAPSNGVITPTPSPVGIDTSTWKSATSGGVTFKYPELGTTYVGTQDWPPAVQVIAGPFSCTDAGEPNAQSGQTKTKTINGHTYCVTVVSEGAAGSIYNQYAYAWQTGTKTLYFTFTLRFPQCDNYDDPQKTACKSEEGAFSADTLADQIIQTAR